VTVTSDGLCHWNPLGIFISSCAIDIRWFPFDDQRCRMKFGSWTHDGTKLNLSVISAQNIDHAVYMPSSEWDLVGRYLCPSRMGAFRVGPRLLAATF